MRTITRIKFGSHLYGTSTPASDIDYKSVFVPSARDIVLQRVKGTISSQRQKGEGEKNVAGEIDEECFSLQRYLSLLSEGQTVSIDVLFAPEWSMVMAPSWEWQEIVRNKHRLLTSRSAAFVGYARKQSAKYGIKGSRMAAARLALSLLVDAEQKHGTSEKLGAIEDHVSKLASETDHLEIADQTLPNGCVIRHWEVCGRKMPYTSSINNGREIMQRLVDEYGHRALMAENNQGVDWKALSHAVRVSQQAIELLNTGHVTFPLPNANHITKIKLGERPYKDVAEEIEELFVAVEAAAETSTLPDKPDLEWIDGFVEEVYRKEICAA
jgi:hypothetical protein